MSTNHLLGVFGDEAPRYRSAILDRAGSGVVADTPTCILASSYEGPIHYPAVVSQNGRSLLMNGLFVLGDGPIGRLLANPRQALEALLNAPSDAIPLAFSNGAFNGVLLESRAITLFNDFFALVPLYYAVRASTVVFSTRLADLARILQPGWDESGIVEFLKTGYLFSYRTILKGVQCLPPASVLRFADGQASLKTFCSFPSEPERKAPLSEVTDDVLCAIRSSVQRMYAPQLKYSISLTGGMDSRIIYLEWPGKKDLVTWTSGEGTSDFLKARALTEKLGNPSLHELEDLKGDRYLEGITAFYDLCDDPTKLMLDYNYIHLEWQRGHHANVHMSGTGGETLNGENLYLSRHPLYVMQEAVLPYRYHPLNHSDKQGLIAGMMYSGYKKAILDLVGRPMSAAFAEGVEPDIVKTLDPYFGAPGFRETYCERFRTLVLANFSYYPMSVGPQRDDHHLYPYSDVGFMKKVCSYHPEVRELRRLEHAILLRHPEAFDIAVDTSHLRIPQPYRAHKFMRAMRMVFNIGLHKKIPIIQKGEPPRFRAAKYFDPAQRELREYINSTIRGCSFLEGSATRTYLEEVGGVRKFSFYTHHNQSANLKVLFRLAMAERKLG